MGLVLGTVYMAQAFAYRAREVSAAQAQFAEDIAFPIRVMDESFSQSITPPFGTVNQPNRVVLRMPVDYLPGQVIEHEYEVSGTRILQRIFRITGVTRTLVRQTNLTVTNANLAAGVPLLTYYRGSTVATDVITANSVVIDVVSDYRGQRLRDRRRIAFRNR